MDGLTASELAAELNAIRSKIEELIGGPAWLWIGPAKGYSSEEWLAQANSVNDGRVWRAGGETPREAARRLLAKVEQGQLRLNDDA